MASYGLVRLGLGHTPVDGTDPASAAEAADTAAAARAMSEGDEGFTPEMRQGPRRRRMKIDQGPKTESPLRTARQRRAYALCVLDSPEQLIMFAQGANDGVTSQRRRFGAILAGFEPSPPPPRASRSRPIILRRRCWLVAMRVGRTGITMRAGRLDNVRNAISGDHARRPGLLSIGAVASSPAA
ncbi:hypothetical protein HRG_013783 [Hirsutella rhossiliensis]